MDADECVKDERLFTAEFLLNSEQRAYQKRGIHSCFDCRQAFGEAKAGNFCSAMLIEQNVCRLKIAVDEALAVQVLQSLRDVLAKLLDGVFWQFKICLKEGLQVSTNTVLKLCTKVRCSSMPAEHSLAHSI